MPNLQEEPTMLADLENSHTGAAILGFFLEVHYR